MLSLQWSERGALSCSVLIGGEYMNIFSCTHVCNNIMHYDSFGHTIEMGHSDPSYTPLSRHKEGVLYMCIKHHESLELINSRSCEHNTPCCSSITPLCLYCSYVYWVLAFDFPRNFSCFFMCTTCMQQIWNSVKLVRLPTFSTRDASHDHIIIWLPYCINTCVSVIVNYSLKKAVVGC